MYMYCRLADLLPVSQHVLQRNEVLHEVSVHVPVLGSGVTVWGGWERKQFSQQQRIIIFLHNLYNNTIMYFLYSNK